MLIMEEGLKKQALMSRPWLFDWALKTEKSIQIPGTRNGPITACRFVNAQSQRTVAKGHLHAFISAVLNLYMFNRSRSYSLYKPCISCNIPQCIIVL